MFKSIRLEKGGNFKFWHREWSVGNKQGGRREIQTSPVDRLVEKKISPSAALSLFLQTRPTIRRPPCAERCEFVPDGDPLCSRRRETTDE
jgi:hypothetical protein